MQHRRRHLRGAVVSTAAFALALTGFVPGYAAPAAPAGDTASAAPTVGPASGGSHKSGTVTLLTGDVVQYAEDANGTPRVTMQPDLRPDRPSVGFISVPEGDSFYVYPSDAMPLVQAGKLDRGLFDVAYLAKNGYGDDTRGTLPVIAQYGSGVANTKAAIDERAEALPANSAATPLTSIHGAGFTVTKEQAGTFWKTIAGTPTPAATSRTAPQMGATTLRTGLTKVWLNRVIKPTLDTSVPQIGAPEAWKAGYDGKGVRVAVLDTGIDEDHPDFAGRIEVQKNFTDDASLHDGFGHGTHVASIIAGSGAASDGKYRGVAPEASLMIGKVLNNGGTGTMEWAIQGMEWAASQGADVVNLSLGAGPGDGTDLSDLAINNLTAQYGTLFVVAAGNDGPTPQTVASPGAADAALTVAAVDRNDKIAPFSSRGPRLGNYGLKPDIAAPGVGIMGAHSEPSIMGGAVGDRYLPASGTSMATPHVAGAAAILAQEHPDWNASKLKPVLVSTAKDAGNRSYEQGAGRVDVARATTQQVYATNSLDFGQLAYPQTGTAQRTTTYVNDSDSGVTLTLKATLSSKDGAAAPAGMLTLDKDTVTVPAHGTATVTATADPTKAPEATWYEGAVRATAQGIEVGTAVGMNIEAQSFNVTAKVIDPDNVSTLPDGTPMIDYGAMAFTRNDGRKDRGGAVFGEELARESTVRLYGGSYSVSLLAFWIDSTGANQGLAIEPEVDVTGDTTVMLDLRKLRKVTAAAPNSDNYLEAVGLTRLGANRVGGVQGMMSGAPAAGWTPWVSPTKKVTLGELDLVSQHLLGTRQITMSVKGHGNTALHPRYQGADTTHLPKLSGRRTLGLVAGGTGTPEDLAGVNAKGKIVLLDLSDLCPQISCEQATNERVAAAAQAGAVAVLGFGTAGHVLLGNAGAPIYAVPTMSIPASEGALLLNRLRQGRVSIDTNGTALTPYYYSLAFNETGQIPTDLDYQVTGKDVYRVDNRFHADTDTTVQMTWSAQDDNALLGFGLLGVQRSARSTLTDYVGPVSSHLLWNRTANIQYLNPATGGLTSNFTAIDYFDRAGQRAESWGEQPFVPAPAGYSKRVMSSPWMARTQCESCRAGDTLVPGISKIDQAGHVTAADLLEVSLTDGDGTSYPVKHRGRLLNAGFFLLRYPMDTFDVPAEKGTYHLGVAATSTYDRQLYSARTDNAYTFTSQRPDAATSGVTSCFGQSLLGVAAPCGFDKSLRLRYGVDLDLANTAVAGSRADITVAGYYGFGLADPKLRSLTLEVSFDDGAHWQSIKTSAGRDGKYSGKISYPTLAKTTGAVSIRAKATDTNGNTIEQTIHRAYGLR